MILITEVRNAVSLNEDNTRFDVEINHPQYGWIPYSLTPEDTDQTINNNDLLVLIGSNFEAYIPPTQQEIDAKAGAKVREQREWLLKNEVDPIVSNPLRWNEMTEDQRNMWSQYRRDLLNVPQQVGFPHDINWPTSP